MIGVDKLLACHVFQVFIYIKLAAVVSGVGRRAFEDCDDVSSNYNYVDVDVDGDDDNDERSRHGSASKSGGDEVCWLTLG